MREERHMSRRIGCMTLGLIATLASISAAQNSPPDPVVALEQGLQESKAALKHYEWVETTTTLMKGEVKSTKQNRCYYDAHGKLTKVATGATSEGGKSPG